MSKTANPLTQYFRSVKMYTSLPSGTTYYNNDIEFDENGEIGIMPMTAKDEVTAKNPDALLNGSAIVDVIKSCVPAVKNPKKLLSNDIDALMIAIRHATHGKDIEITSNCPECEEENKYSINIDSSLSSMTKLEPEYSLSLESGIVIHVQPFGFTETIKALNAQFKQYKIIKNLSDDELSDERRISIFSSNVTSIASLNAELLTSSIIKITTPDETVITERKFIAEFLQNIDKNIFDDIDNLINEINSIGVKKNFDATCEKCKNKWEAEIDFNPVNFFTDS